jgi:transposase InsO family protein
VLDVNIARRAACLSARAEAEARRWHARLEHVNMPVLRQMANQELVKGMPSLEQVEGVCEACMTGKQRRTVFPDQAAWRAEHGLELVHGDLCGPISPATPSGNFYFLLLVDDHSRYMWISTLVSKNQAAAAIMEFQAQAEGESGHKLLMLRADRGGEFTLKQFAEYCVQEGVQRQLTTSYSPQQNGVVEHRNAMVVGAARSMLKQKGLPG